MHATDLCSLLGLHIQAMYQVGPLEGWEEDFTGPFQLLLMLSDEWLVHVEAPNVSDYLHLHLSQGRGRAQALADASAANVAGPHPVLPGNELAPLLGQHIARVRLAQATMGAKDGSRMPTDIIYNQVLQIFTMNNVLTLFNTGHGFLFMGLNAGPMPVLEQAYTWYEFDLELNPMRTPKVEDNPTNR